MIDRGALPMYVSVRIVLSNRSLLIDWTARVIERSTGKLFTERAKMARTAKAAISIIKTVLGLPLKSSTGRYAKRPGNKADAC